MPLNDTVTIVLSALKCKPTDVAAEINEKLRGIADNVTYKMSSSAWHTKKIIEINGEYVPLFDYADSLIHLGSMIKDKDAKISDIKEFANQLGIRIEFKLLRDTGNNK